MHAVILAGGKGTRLRPLTLHTPKPVVPLVNRPFLAYQLDLLAAAGVDDVTLSLNYRPEGIRRAMEGVPGSEGLRYIVEDSPLGTGGAVRFAAKEDAGAVVVLNGDILNDLDLAAVIRSHRERQAGVTIVLTEVDDPTNYGLVRSDAGGRVVQFLEKPGWEEIDTLRTVNAGTYVIEPEYLDMMPRGTHLSIEREFFPLLVERGAPFFAFIHRGHWMDIGTVAKYLRAHGDFFRRGERLPAGYREAGRNLFVAEGAAAAEGVEAGGPVVLGQGSQVGSGSVFHRFCVIGRNCTIGEGAHLDGCVLWDGVTVGAGARLKGCVVGEGSRVGEHARLGGLFALGDGSVIPDYSHLTELDGVFGEE